MQVIDLETGDFTKCWWVQANMQGLVQVSLSLPPMQEFSMACKTKFQEKQLSSVSGKQCCASQEWARRKGLVRLSERQSFNQHPAQRKLQGKYIILLHFSKDKQEKKKNKQQIPNNHSS